MLSVSLYVLLFMGLIGGDKDLSCSNSKTLEKYDPCSIEECELSCPLGSDLKVADPENCQNYFECVDYYLAPRSCPVGFLFNSKSNKCQKNVGNWYSRCQQPCASRNPSYKKLLKNFTIKTTVVRTFSTPTDILPCNNTRTTSHTHKSSTAMTTSESLTATMLGDTKITTESLTSSSSSINFTENLSPFKSSTINVQNLITTEPPSDGHASDPLIRNLYVASIIEPSISLSYKNKPYVYGTPNLKPIYEGSSVTFSCTQPIENSQVFWYFEEKKLFVRSQKDLDGDDRLMVRTYDSKINGSNYFLPPTKSTFLEIDSLTEKDTGNYKCGIESDTVKNIQFSGNIYLKVYPPPKLVITPNIGTLIKDQYMIFHCKLVNHGNYNASGDLCVNNSFRWLSSDKIFRTGNDVTEMCVNNFYVLTNLSSGTITFTCEYNSSSYSLSKTLELQIISNSTKQCSSITDNYKVTWNITKAGTYAYQQCPETYIGTTKKYCQLNNDGTTGWLETNIEECLNEKMDRVVNELKLIEEGWGLEDPMLIAKQSAYISNFTLEEYYKLTKSDLNATIRSLKLFNNIRKNNPEVSIESDEFKSIFKIMNNVLKSSNEKAWSILLETNPSQANIIMKLSDLYSTRIDLNDANFDEGLIAMQMSSVSFYDEKLPIDDSDNQANSVCIEPPKRQPRPSGAAPLPPGLAPLPPGADPLPPGAAPHTPSPIHDTIHISKQFLKPLPTSGLKASRIALPKICSIYYTNLEKLLPVPNNHTFIASRVLSVEVIGIDRPQSVAEGINITFYHSLLNVTTTNASRICVFWNFSIGASGEWSTNGCRMLMTNETMTICSCDHMTNFALLMSVDQTSTIDNIIINTISLIGCIISIVALILTVIIIGVSWKWVKTPHHYAILINLCLALIIADAVFIGGADKTQPRELCITIAVLLHLFYMAAFFMMLAEGVQLLIYVVHVYHAQRRKETAAIIVSAWVCAIVIVAISLGVTRTVGYGNDKYCWLSAYGGLMWAFIGPALFIITANLIILIVVLKNASRVKQAAENQKKTLRIKATIWNILVISPLLGVTWIFGVLSVTQPLVAFQYIFAIVNSLQGLFIFVFHGLCSQIRINKKNGTGLFGKKSSSQEKNFCKVEKKFQSNSNNNVDPSNHQQMNCSDNGAINVNDLCADLKNVPSITPDIIHSNPYFRCNFEENPDYKNESSNLSNVFRNILGSQSTQSSYVNSM